MILLKFHGQHAAFRSCTMTTERKRTTLCATVTLTPALYHLAVSCTRCALSAKLSLVCLSENSSINPSQIKPKVSGEVGLKS